MADIKKIKDFTIVDQHGNPIENDSLTAIGADAKNIDVEILNSKKLIDLQSLLYGNDSEIVIGEDISINRKLSDLNDNKADKTAVDNEFKNYTTTADLELKYAKVSDIPTVPTDYVNTTTYEEDKNTFLLNTGINESANIKNLNASSINGINGTLTIGDFISENITITSGIFNKINLGNYYLSTSQWKAPTFTCDKFNSNEIITKKITLSTGVESLMLPNSVECTNFRSKKIITDTLEGNGITVNDLTVGDHADLDSVNGYSLDFTNAKIKDANIATLKVETLILNNSDNYSNISSSFIKKAILNEKSDNKEDLAIGLNNYYRVRSMLGNELENALLYFKINIPGYGEYISPFRSFERLGEYDNNKSIIYRDTVQIEKSESGSKFFMTYIIQFGAYAHQGDTSSSDFYLQVDTSIPQDVTGVPSGEVDLSGIEIKLYSINL